MKAGDWNCSCGELNFASRDACRKCGANKSGVRHVVQKVGDWNCVVCGKLNFAHRRCCMSCKYLSPALAGNAQRSPPVVSKPGDWNCACGEMNFARNEKCRKCNTAKVQAVQPAIPAALSVAIPMETEAEEEDEEKNLCVVCMSSKAEAAITVCGHLALCLECAPKLRSCPMCRAAYTPDQILKIFHSGI